MGGEPVLCRCDSVTVSALSYPWELILPTGNLRWRERRHDIGAEELDKALHTRITLEGSRIQGIQRSRMRHAPARQHPCNAPGSEPLSTQKFRQERDSEAGRHGGVQDGRIVDGELRRKRYFRALQATLETQAKFGEVRRLGRQKIVRPQILGARRLAALLQVSG